MSATVKLNGNQAAPAESSSASTQTEPSAQTSRFFSAGDVRILVIDDDPTIGRLVQAAFASHDFTIDVVSDPEQIENGLKQGVYHVVVLDYVLPGRDSAQLVQAVRDLQPEASVIVVTAYPSIDSALNCLRARTYDYLTKPFQVAHLQRIVTSCLESKGLLRLTEAALRESLGSAIRERRKGLGLTLAQMAQRTSVSLGYLSQIELGKNSASIETLYRISLGLGMKMSELFQTVQNPA